MDNHKVNVAAQIIYIAYCDAGFAALVYEQHIYIVWYAFEAKNGITNMNLFCIQRMFCVFGTP